MTLSRTGSRAPRIGARPRRCIASANKVPGAVGRRRAAGRGRANGYTARRGGSKLSKHLAGVAIIIVCRAGAKSAPAGLRWALAGVFDPPASRPKGESGRFVFGVRHRRSPWLRRRFSRSTWATASVQLAIFTRGALSAPLVLPPRRAFRLTSFEFRSPQERRAAPCNKTRVGAPLERRAAK